VVLTMLSLVISGGQSGADQAGWRAAKAAGITTGGSMPLEFLTEDGPRPDFAELYGAHQLDSADYPARTEANIRASDGTLWFGSPHTPEFRCTSEWTFKANKPMRIMPSDGISPPVRPSDIVRWISLHKIRVLNIAGNRESKAPGIGLRVQAFLERLFAITQR
jgi:hypothetical protein